MSEPLFSRRAAQGLLLAVSLASLLICPHSKVEESFQLQAVHDLFYFGVSPLFTTQSFADLPYDHLKYPGVVPRTFVGPLVLSSICQFVRILLLPLMDIADHPSLVQFVARFSLLSLQMQGWYRMARAVDLKTSGMTTERQKSTGRMIAAPNSWTGNYLLLVTAVQFHAPFYASRLLANSFATVLTLHVFSDWLTGRFGRAVAGLVVAAALIRCDLLLLLATCGLSWLVMRQLTVFRALWLGIISMAVTLSLSVPIDSLLWRRWVWPEGVVAYENIVRNKSAEYGTSPWHWYATSAMPKAMLLTLALLPLSLVRLELLSLWIGAGTTAKAIDKNQRPLAKSPPSLLAWCDTTWLAYLLPAIGFVALYSFLSHKEIRFLFPVLPIFNLGAAVGAGRIHAFAWPSKGKPATKLGLFEFLILVIILVSSLVASSIFVLISSWNYPGGQALQELSRVVKESSVPEVRVYIDVASAMSGVSLFGQRAAQLYASNSRWSFEKGGYEEEHSQVADYSTFTHILSEDPAIPGFEVVALSQGYPRLDVRHRQVVTSDAIYVLGRQKTG